MSDAKHTNDQYCSSSQWVEHDTGDTLYECNDPAAADELAAKLNSCDALLEFAERVLDPKNAGVLMQADLGFGLAVVAQAKGETA